MTDEFRPFSLFDPADYRGIAVGTVVIEHRAPRIRVDGDVRWQARYVNRPGDRVPALMDARFVFERDDSPGVRWCSDDPFEHITIVERRDMTAVELTRMVIWRGLSEWSWRDLDDPDEKRMALEDFDKALYRAMRRRNPYAEPEDDDWEAGAIACARDFDILHTRLRRKNNSEKPLDGEADADL